MWNMKLFCVVLFCGSYRFRPQGPGHTEATPKLQWLSTHLRLEVQKYTLVLSAHLKQVCTFELCVKSANSGAAAATFVAAAAAIHSSFSHTRVCIMVGPKSIS